VPTTGRFSCVTNYEGKPLWYDSVGRPVDVHNIDKEYALNILTMVAHRRGRTGYTLEDLRHDELVAALRETVLHGREPTDEDRERAAKYNELNAQKGLPYRAPER
jgi:hypothetical protein